jgi:hypothetical protein
LKGIFLYIFRVLEVMNNLDHGWFSVRFYLKELKRMPGSLPLVGNGIKLPVHHYVVNLAAVLLFTTD